LAAEGLTGPAPIFEGELGLEKLIVKEPIHLAPLAGEAPAGAGAPADQPANKQPFMTTATYIKFWPAEYHSQSAIDAALQLRPSIVDVEQIQKIDIHTFNAAVDIIGKD